MSIDVHGAMGHNRAMEKAPITDQYNVQQPRCKGGHLLEQGKTVNSKGYCNLCLRDIQRRKPVGTTASERGLAKA